jgi:hypothetical protein
MLEYYSHIRLMAKRAAVDALDTFKPPLTATPETNTDNPPMVN